MLRERVKPAFSKVSPAIAIGTSRIKGNANKYEAVASVGTLAPPGWNVLPCNKDESYRFNNNARETEGSLCRKVVQQPDSRDCDEPSGQHQEEARKFQCSTVNAKIA